MRIRKFVATSAQAAMNQVKLELGEDAVILHTRTYPGKFFGLLGKPKVEVTAAIEDKQPSFSAKTYSNPTQNSGTQPLAPPAKTGFTAGDAPAHAAAREFLSRLQEIRQNEPGKVETKEHGQEKVEIAQSGMVSQVETVHEERFGNLENRIDRLSQTMDRLLSLGGPLGRMGLLSEVPEAWHPAMKNLLEGNLLEDLLKETAAKLKSIPHPGKDLEPKILCEVLSGFLKSAKPIEKPESGQRVITLIGPTGVGKTTTLAKLASGLVVNAKVPTRVGLITVDTYRLAAVEQLQTYAKILNLDLQVVYSPEELPAAVEKCRECDVVFIDTAGRSPRDENQMLDLKSFLEKVPDCENILVLSSTMNDRYLELAVERFRSIPIDSLIVTKLDETNHFATPLNIHRKTGLPLSYITTGQNVPEDIENVQPEKLAKQILDEVGWKEDAAIPSGSRLEAVSA
ncbi:MAG: flagellar biosynthesis protein FlhF [Candidatus Omnitrophica bacterium]|nr:flagellar biosynthesis protein FlhF [Candidatus Omnitrophota bacterium]MCA9415596.1 flagellar biosynthesis protein FlhF [Candidatus Omnitrophota bacterium]MCA9423516.1 flagellar biosynthesis protein FlhF [Candidatus Omnitrophota bacterium]MCA9446120.1 flagellar biosynthesis protein FlhF [Candidatus Omnitrophota bacterium]MCB9768154.1 flagellar biosynthesis protein FlhF [Candidatus Omnitrophota bacterium]